MGGVGDLVLLVLYLLGEAGVADLVQTFLGL